MAGVKRQITLSDGRFRDLPSAKSSLMALTPQSLSPFLNDASRFFMVKKKASIRVDGCFRLYFMFLRRYLLFLLNSLRKLSMAMVIDGALGLGAWRSSLKPSLVTASAVVGPKAAILTSPCTNVGKF